MKHTRNHMEDILSRGISGFHQYVLEDPVHISYASENLCAMAGVTEGELLSKSEDLYLSLVHPADRDRYLQFIQELKAGERTLSLEYRLVKKDGTLLYVKDTAVSERREDGVLVGNSRACQHFTLALYNAALLGLALGVWL